MCFLPVDFLGVVAVQTDGCGFSAIKWIDSLLILILYTVRTNCGLSDAHTALGGGTVLRTHTLVHLV